MISYKISKRPRILFVGINPHPGSYRRGVPFSNNKMFWYLLSQAGLIQETTHVLRDDLALKQIYDKKFILRYQLNFVNLVDRPTVDVTELKRGEEQAGVRRLARVIEANKPKVVCFIGKIAFNTYRATRQCDWGWQAGPKNTKVYLMHFPIRGPAEVRVRELLEIGRASETVRPTVARNMKIKLKRAYEKPEKADGTRILVDRLWPRGLTKAKAAIEIWLKEIAPSTELRKWFGHDPKKWRGFRGRYETELKSHGDQLRLIKAKAKDGTVTLVYGARDQEHNEAVVLQEWLERR